MVAALKFGLMFRRARSRALAVAFTSEGLAPLPMDLLAMQMKCQPWERIC